MGPGGTVGNRAEDDSRERLASGLELGSFCLRAEHELGSARKFTSPSRAVSSLRRAEQAREPQAIFPALGTDKPRVVSPLVCGAIFAIDSERELFLLIHAPRVPNEPKILACASPLVPARIIVHGARPRTRSLMALWPTERHREV